MPKLSFDDDENKVGVACQITLSLLCIYFDTTKMLFKNNLSLLIINSRTNCSRLRPNSCSIEFYKRDVLKNKGCRKF